MRRLVLLLVGALLALLPAGCGGGAPTHSITAAPESGLPAVAYEGLPAQAHETLRLIEAGGPYPYRRDGSVFGNRERLLPAEPGGYYREYTVRTPGSPDRGARRIVAGEAGERFYTDDHYRSFREVVGP